jgi:sarcosine oxidase subunit beta
MSIRHYCVVVIGAGSVGTVAAFALARAGIRTLVIDRMPSVGQGCNKHAIGGVRATHSDPAKIALCLSSIETLSTWRERYGDDIEWCQGGYLFVAYRAHEAQVLRELLAVQRAHGLHIDWLDRQSLLVAVPDLNPDGLIGGTYSPDDGTASPLLTVHAFYRHAKRLGAEFHFGERVTGIVVRGGRARGVRTDRAQYGAEVVINAAGAQASLVARLSGEKVPVFPDAHEAGVTEPVARFLKPLVVDLQPFPGSSGCYLVQIERGQVLFCVTPSPRIWGEDIRETSQFLPLVAPRLIRLVPRLGHIRVRRTWRGLYPMTPDGLPLVGWSRAVEGVLLAVGMCGQGFMLGPGLGELLARMVQGTLTAQDRETLADLSPYRAFAGQEKLK